MIRDTQKNKVYRFEDKVIGPFDKNSITLSEAQDFVEFIWANEGRSHPPKITSSNRFKNIAANANRNRICVKGETTKRWIMVHEVTHSLLWEMDDEGNDIQTIAHHGPEFVMKYITLLDKYLKIPFIMSMAMCKKEGVKVIA